MRSWNPDNWDWYGWDEAAGATEAGGIFRGRWSTGSRKGGVEPGDRVFLLKQGDEPRGIVGSGTCSSRIFQDEHWDDERAGEDANYVLIEWDTIVTEDSLLPHVEVLARIPAGGVWRPQGSGTLLAANVAADLEALWAEHLQQPAPVPPRTSPRQGWQLDAERRKKVEDAAQVRLEQHLRDQGWEVKDVRFGNSYDATATKAGQPILYLEAKGTETAGTSVISVVARSTGHATTRASACSASSPMCGSCRVATSIGTAASSVSTTGYRARPNSRRVSTTGRRPTTSRGSREALMDGSVPYDTSRAR